jgi:hypothetical protein
MRKILITGLVIMLAAYYLPAQVYIQTTLPSAGLVQKNQLWNLVLVNGTTGPVEGKLTLVLRNRQSGMELMTASTNRFTVPKGSLSVNVNNLNPIQYNYMGMNPNTALNGLLPVGAYTACYSFSKIDGERLEQLTEECTPFDVEPLSPPMLIYPSDSAELDAAPAQFTWMPPTPAGMMNRLRYDILITEILPNQKPAEAIQQNTPFYNTADINNNFITYPAALPAFEKEKWYSWQVVARDDKSYAAKTETWVFKIKKENAIPKKITGYPYLKMSSHGAEMGIAPNGILKITCFNRTSDTSVRVVIYDLSAPQPATEVASFTENTKPGENQLTLKLERKMNPVETHTYKAEITYSSGEKNTVLFQVKKLNDKEGINHQ